ncbi:MAG: 16S rRNA (uracil(1498)-N(3))-methyltransferase [Gammaproteobacteria bacterium]|nr:16S rRNA (uracil(1498)-N(3))-methyltransferase [Gammaproteobacteria bacterium]
MRIPRIFTTLPLQVGSELELEQHCVRHLLQVLRLKTGAPLILFNGDSRDYSGKLIECGRKMVRVAISDCSDTEPPPLLEVNLGLGLSKGERMDFAIQKSVELGVTSITPLLTEHAVVRLTDERLANRTEHWRRVVTAACEQSGRRRLPDFNAPLALTQWLAVVDKPEASGVLLDHRACHTLDQINCEGQTINLLIGPEGGLSAAERKAAQAAGFQPVQLGPRTLRTETAPLAAISAIQMLWGDFRRI